MTIDNYNFAGKKAIVRVDFNVPLNENGIITDDTRIRGALPTLKKILADGGALIIMSHMGKPKGKVNMKMSLGQITEAVAAALGTPVKFASDCAKAADEAAALKPGEVLLLENLRFYPEEEGKPVGIDKEDPVYEEAKKAMKASQKEFAKTLASYADCYVNDAFGTAHRKHASTAVIADYFDADNKMLGYLMEKEVQAVDNILSDIKHPFTAIMGGSKVSTKIGIIENLMDKVDNLILCGGMTYTFAKAQGGKIGQSICEDDKLDLALDIIAQAKAKGVNLVLATDCLAADAFSNDANTQVVSVNEIPEGWEGMDAGPEAQKAFAAAIEGAKTILWNGPAGVFEFDNFTAGSRAIAEAIAKATANGAYSLIGGGDSVACINKFGMADKVSYISTGGGALLEAIEGKVLPGVAAIKG
ncbi:MAG: phosphoglycerate kinase [Paludibacter sp.]|nr:phosphoglycerate kinase [Bacteroidales bacterium]MCM1068523.1 phosphoglycerate kinase [Prevotella sp.]MCM1353477.1 phosphoglycerate kinase [Bacteroides sp.]MCM1442638.1 phosphoglycerate kinase [Muribaculum sp.]MCM1481483.1 phosphoglycerate kinase [Paludibacter sp.]